MQTKRFDARGRLIPDSSLYRRQGNLLTMRRRKKLGAVIYTGSIDEMPKSRKGSRKRKGLAPVIEIRPAEGIAAAACH